MASAGCLAAYKKRRVQVGFSRVMEGLKERLADWIPASFVLPLFVILSAGLIFAVVGPVFVAYQRTTNHAASSSSGYCGLSPNQTNDFVGCSQYDQVSSAFASEVDDPTTLPTAVFLRSRFTELDLVAGTATLETEVFPIGDIGNDQGELNVPDGVNLTIIIGSQTKSFQSGDRPDRISTDLDLDAYKPLYQYPFDKYKSDINYKAFLVVGDKTTKVFVPVVVQLNTGLPSFNIKADDNTTALHARVVPTTSQVFTGVQLERSVATKFFSMFIVVAMWALSASTLVFIIDLVYVRPHEIGTDDLIFVSSVLFALPGVRAVQPGVPDGGASVDVLGYFWNMAIVVISACIALAGMVGQFIVENKEGKAMHEHGEDLKRSSHSTQQYDANVKVTMGSSMMA